MEPSPLKSFSCPACGAQQNIRGLGQTSTMGCEYCGTIIDLTNDCFRIIQEGIKRTRPLVLALGARGTLYDTQYEVIGCIGRCDSSRLYKWDEYLLFNPYKGFAWLAQFEGHWNYIFSTKERPVPTSDGVIFEGLEFKRFLFDSATVISVIGECYWEVKVEDTVRTQDYIRPPYILSCEFDGQEQVWSRGELQPAEKIQAAFKLKSDLPPAKGIYANQPNRYQHAKRTAFCGLAFLFFATLIHAILGPSGIGKAVLDQTINIQQGKSTIAYVTNEFDVPGSVGNLAVVVSAPVDNNWVYAELTLVNTATKDDDDGAVEVSYYHGADSDGPWTEGNNSSEALFSAVPAGRYSLTLETETGMGAAANPSIESLVNQYRSSGPPPLQLIPLRVIVRRNVSYSGNFLAALVLLAIYPAYCLLRYASFESTRWQSSDQSGDDDE